MSNMRKKVNALDVEKEFTDLINTQRELAKTADEDVRAGLEEKIINIQASLKNKIKKGNDIYNSLSDGDIEAIENQSDLADAAAFRITQLNEKLNKGQIDQKQYDSTIDIFLEKYKNANDKIVEIASKKVTETVRKQVGAIADEQGVEGVVTEATGQEILDMQGEKLARLTAERDSNQEIIDDPNQTVENKKIAEENVKDLQQQINDVENADATFGYIDEKIDDKGNLTGDFEIVINKDKPMIGTAAHEFMHKVLFKTLKGNKDLQTNVGDAVTTFINEEKEGFDKPFISRMSAYINPIKDKDGKVVRDKDGNVQFEKVSEFGEEVVTVMSESILDGSLKYNENLFTKLGDIIRQNLQRYGFKSIQFNSGRDVYNFIKDFNKSIEKGYISEAITEVAVKGAKGKLVEGKKKAKPTAKRKMSKVSPKAKQFLEAEIDGELIYTNEMLVDIINSESSSQENKFGAVEALIEKNWPVISKSLKFNPTGDISMESIKTAISEQMTGIFPKITLPNGQTINREGKRLLDTYNKENTVTTFLDNTLGPRQAEIFTRAKTIDAKSQGVSLDEAKNIAVSTELENETSNQRDTRKRVNVLKIPKVARVAKDIRQDTRIEEGDTHKQVTKNNEGHIGNKIFNIPENKITKPKDNLTTSDDIVDVKTGEVITKEELDAGATGILSPSESKNIQDVFSDYETSEQFIKILPKTNVSEKDALVNEVGENIPVSRDVYGRAIGLQDRILEYFYEPLMKPNGKRARSQGKTSQVPLWTLKEEFINPKKDAVVQFQRDLGITEKKQINILPTKEKRSEIGQLLKGAARTLSQQVSLSAAQRNLEAMGAPKQQIADITAAQRRRAYSRDIKRYRNVDKLVPVDKLAPRDQVFLLREDEAGFIEGEIITRKHLDSYYDKKNKITWEEFYMNELLDFFESYPQYYDIMAGALTGGVKKAAFFNKPYFKKAIKKFAKKNNKQQIVKLISKTKQTGPKRLYYHEKSKWKGLKNLDLSKDNGKTEFLINFYNNISKHTKKQGKEIFQEVLTHFGIDQNNFMRKSAKLIIFPVDKDGVEITDQKGVEEHAVQMEMARIMMGSAFDGNMKDATKLLRAVYSQASLLKVEDPSGEYKESMGDDFYNDVVPRILDGSLDWLPPGYASIYRLMKAGVNPFGYKLINENQIIAEYFGVNNLSVEKAQQAIIDVFEGKQDIKVLREQSKVKYSKDIDGHNKLNKATIIARKSSKDPKGITVLDFDDTLATTKSLVKYTTPDGKTGTLNAEEYASTYQDLLDQGFKFDFSEFNRVVKGKIAPLFQKALKLQGKFGPENMFVLTARPMAAQKAIFDFLKANGLNIPIKNITGLGNSTAEAKALWIADKVGEGFNDFYFADDALQNVQAVDNVLSQFDVKRKVQQAKVKFSKGTLSTKQDLNWKTDSIGYMTTSFNIDGNNYKITFYPTDLNDTNYELEFDLVTEKGLTQEMTGTGNQFKVLGVVYNGLLDVIKQNPNIETIGFSSLTKDKSRARVYTILMDRLGKKLGWKTDIYEYGSGTQLDFEVARPKTRKARTKTTESIRNIPAVKNILNQSDIKSPTQQAKVKFSKSMNTDFNNILENITGIESKKRFSAIKARKRGENKGKFRFFIPPSHEDFVGLLYNFMGKGKEGNAHRDFFEKALVRPLNRAYRELNAAKQSIANDYKALNKQFADVKKKLTKKTPDGDFTYQDAIRVYLWNKHGHKVAGLSPTDQQNLVDLVMGNPELQTYAETLNVISKREDYVKPTENWETGDLRTDLDDATGRIGRAEFFTEFFENADIIFSQENLNKIEAAYGAEMVSALKDILYRTKTGRNRPSGQNKMVNQFLNYLNGSVASTMFFNIRSAVLQQMSMVNFINYADNNVFAAAKAFANQKQYWSDWATIFNSDYMKQRRGGIKTDVNGAELAATVKDSTNPINAAIKKLLELGFLPTQIGDNIAIATGGSTFYRNRINTYIKEGLSQKEAESKAWTDFQVLAEATQQSARPDMVSQQQASPLGKVILAFQNVTSQFNRLGKKAFLDIKNRRITPGNPTQLQSDMSNLSRIAYYFAIQNLIFYTLQSALFMAMFDDDEEDERWLKKKERMINGSIDSVLRGTGVWGAAVATLKNMAIKWHEQRDKGWNKDESAVLMEMLNVSPPIGIKARKMVNAEKTLNYNKKVIDEMNTFDIDNPIWSAVTSYTEATTNVPLNRLYNKTQNVRESLDNQHNALERVLMFSGWSKWNLGIGDSEKIKDIKEKVKTNKNKSKFKGIKPKFKIK